MIVRDKSMVEPNGPQRTLPGTTAPEETKGEKTFMSGTQEDFEADVMQRLTGVELNSLEEGLLKKYLKNRETCVENVLKLLKKLELKYADDNYSLKRIRKVIPLFEEHDFWSHQPVPKYHEMVNESDFNKPIEIKTVS